MGFNRRHVTLPSILNCYASGGTEEVINYVTKKIKRGYYETTFELITETPKDYKNYDITDKYIKLTEENIKEQPAYYLWSHKRFKHQHRYEEWLNSRNVKTQTKQ